MNTVFLTLCCGFLVLVGGSPDVCDNSGTCQGASVEQATSHLDELARCGALSDVDEAGCTAEQCDWVLYKGGAFCTKRFVVPRLSDDEAREMLGDDDSIRAWGAQHCVSLGWKQRTGPLPRIYDTFIFYNEIELLEIRLNELTNVVDQFLLVEADKTFTYKDKPLYYFERRGE